MSRYSETVRDEIERPIPGALVYVYDWDVPSQSTGQLSPLTDDDLTTALSNPLTTDEFGQFYFNSTDGVKLIEYHYAAKLLFREQIILTPAGFYPGNDATLRADLAASGGAALIANTGGGTIQDAVFVKGNATAVGGVSAKVNWKREDALAPAAGYGGLWSSPILLDHAVTKAFPTGSATAGMPTVTFFMAAKNTGSAGDAVAHMAVAEVSATGKRAFAGNDIAFSSGGVSGYDLIGREIDIEPQAGTTPNSVLALAINAFTMECPGNAIYIEGLAGGYFSSGIRVGRLNSATGAGLYGTGQMGCLINTSTGTYGEAAIVVSNMHKIKFKGTATAHGFLYMDGSNFLHMAAGSAGFVILDDDDTTNLVAVTNNSNNGRVDIKGASGELQVNGTKVVGARQTGTAANATDLATAISLVNDLKTKLTAHGLIS